MYSQYTHNNSINSLRYWIRISFNFKSNVEKDSSSLLLPCIKVYMCFIQRCTISQQPSYANCTPTHTHCNVRILKREYPLSKHVFTIFFLNICCCTHNAPAISLRILLYVYVWEDPQTLLPSEIPPEPPIVYGYTSHSKCHRKSALNLNQTCADSRACAQRRRINILYVYILYMYECIQYITSFMLK